MRVDLLLVTVALVGLGLALAGWLAARLRLPTVVGYMVVGLILSEALLAPSLGFDSDTWQLLGHLAVLPVLFFIGLELDLKRIREALGAAALTLPLDLAVPALAVASLARLFGWSISAALALGLCAALSSTLFGERLASTQGFGPDSRKRALGVLLAEDIGATLVLALVVLLSRGSGGAQADWLAAAGSVGALLFWFVLLVAAALLVLPRFLDALARTHSHELLVLGSLGVVVGFAAIGFWAGSIELGALVGGVAAAEAGSRFVVRNALQSVREVALASFFFVSGLSVDPRDAVGNLPLAAGVAGLFLVGKVAVHIPAAVASGLKPEAAMRTAFALGTMGEFNLILVSAAAAEAGAHPALRSTILGAMLMLLVATPLLLRATPFFMAATRHLPGPLYRTATNLVESLRRAKPPRSDPARRRTSVRVLFANILLLAAVLSLAYAFTDAILARLPSRWGPAALFGTVLFVCLPFLYNAYRAYRELVRGLAGIEEEAQESARLRSRLVDAWVAVTASLLLLPISLLAPTSIYVLLGGLVVAALLVAVAGRQLARFHGALSRSVTRVLGQEAAEGELLDRVLQKYPWGVRFIAVAVPRESPLAGRSLAQARITPLTGATVAVLQRGRKEILDPPATETLHIGDTLVIMGEPHQLARAETLVVAHGDAIRLTAQSRLAEVKEVTLEPGSPLVGTLAVADLRSRTGALLAGVWRKGMSHPEPSHAEDPPARVEPGDRLIVMGSPLQVQRVRDLAKGSGPAAPAGSGGARATDAGRAGWGDLGD